MIHINLDKAFSPFGEENIKNDIFDFPSGIESHIKFSVNNIVTNKPVLITTRGGDLMTLFLTTDALKRMGVKDIEVFIPYLPYARQDRIMVKGEPLSVKVLADLINLQGYSKVRIYDPHSEVCLALINNSEAIYNFKFVEEVLKNKKDYLIVSPDAGAYKKIFNVCQYIGYKDDIIICNKTRNVKDGSLGNITVPVNDFKKKDLYIIDDICDGGGTFVLLAKELKKRNAGKVNLIVSHGIFSKGLKVLEGIDHIYTTDSFMDINSMNEFGMHNERYLDKVTQIKLTTSIL